jgi:peroxin-13
MVQVAEQFSSLRNTLGSILGIFTLLRWIRTLLAKVTGQPPPASSSSLTPANFAAFEGRPITLPDGTLAPASAHPKPSKKPFLVFLLAAFGLPYLMGKLIRVLAKSQEEAAARQQQQAPQPGEVLDPSQLEFCRLLYDFPPPNHDAAAVSGVDLQVKKGDLVAVLTKLDPLGQPSDWWRCRARDGRVGYLPGVYLEEIKRKQIANAAASRTSSLTSRSGVMEEVKEGDFSAEAFQKAQFHS